MKTDRLVIRNARLLTCTEFMLTEPSLVVVGSDGRLEYLGPEERYPAQLPATGVVDVAGRTVMPGMIDAHVHVGGVGEYSTWLDRPWSYRAMQAVQSLGRMLDAGVTTARDMGGLDRGFRDAVEDSLIEGPRLRLALSLITPTGGHADMVSGGGLDLGPRLFLATADQPIGLVADTDDEVRRAARRLVRSEADLIKVSTTGGPGVGGAQPDDEGVPEAQVRVAVEEASRVGLPVSAHAMGRSGIVAAVRGGAASVEHGWEIDEQVAEEMVHRDVWLVPTLSGAHHFLNAPAGGAGRRAKGPHHWARLALQNIPSAISRGVPVAMGSDLSGELIRANGRELGHLVEAGMDNAGALAAATVNAARLLGVEQEVGTLEVGKLADLIVIDGDPTADVRILGDPANITMVTLGGRVVRDSGRLAA